MNSMALNVLYKVFFDYFLFYRRVLLCDATQSAVMPQYVVRLSVCLPVTF